MNWAWIALAVMVALVVSAPSSRRLNVQVQDCQAPDKAACGAYYSWRIEGGPDVPSMTAYCAMGTK